MVFTSLPVSLFSDLPRVYDSTEISLYICEEGLCFTDLLLESILLRAVSAGGFSNYFERPYYQQLAVTSYLLQHDKSGQFPSSSSFNHKGRAFPDISAIGVAFQIIFQNNSVEDSGTSASCPTIAAIVSLINTARSQLRTLPCESRIWVYSLTITIAGHCSLPILLTTLLRLS
tara:strand:+ start:1765 stop:2283 length:519 start_codon:yes stop_codon:yes gene_type:complete